MSAEQNKPSGYSGHATFTIDDIAAMLPGPARLMHEIGIRWTKVYYAAQAGNWPLSEYEVHEVEELFETCMVTRPKYVQWMEPFMKTDIGNLRKAIKAQNWDDFQKAFHESVKNANDYHKAANKPLLVWKLPDTPPSDMDFRPQLK